MEFPYNRRKADNSYSVDRRGGSMRKPIARWVFCCALAYGSAIPQVRRDSRFAAAQIREAVANVCGAARGRSE
jgi:hypothetical protein